MKTSIADQVKDDNLISPPLRDQLAVKILSLQEKEGVTQELVKIESAKRALESKKEKYLLAFEKLYYKYLGLSKESLKQLSIEEIDELRDMFYEKAKGQLWWKIPLWSVCTFGWIPAFFTAFFLANTFPNISGMLATSCVIDILFGMLWGLDMSNLPTWRFVRLHNWHKKAEIESERKKEFDDKRVKKLGLSP